MSPRRKVEPTDVDFFEVAPPQPRRWGVPVIAAVATLLIAAAITASTLMLIGQGPTAAGHSRDAAALGASEHS